MARYNGPVCRLCRREGMKLFLKGAAATPRSAPSSAARRRPASTACAAARCPSTASSCARSRRCGASTCVLERQFKRYFETAEHRPGVTGENLLRLLETRLDNVVFRMGFATSRAQARQLVGHGHFAVNGRATDHPLVPGPRGRPDRGPRGAAASPEYFKNVKDALRAPSDPTG